MRNFVLILLLLLSFWGFSQNNLSADYEKCFEKNDTSVYDIAEKIINEYCFFSPDSAMNCCEKTMFFARKNNDLTAEVRFMLLKSNILLIKQNYTKAIVNYYNILEKIELYNNKLLYANILLKISEIFIDNKFDLDNVKEYITTARKIYKKNGNTEGEINTYLLLCEYYINIENYKLALFNINNAFSLTVLSDNRKMRAKVYFCLSKLFYAKKDLKNAAYLFDVTYLGGGDFYLKTEFINYFGNIFEKTSQFDLAENMYNTELLNFQKNNNLVGEAQIYKKLSNINILKDDIATAKKYSLNSLIICDKLNLYELKKNVYYDLSRIYSNQKKLDSATFYFEKYSNLYDSLSLEKNLNTIYITNTNILWLYKQNHEKSQLKASQNKRKLLIYIIILLTVIIFVAVLVLTKAIRELKQNQKRLQRLTDITIEGIVIHDGDNVLEVNDKLCKMLGYERNDLVGIPVLKLLSQASQQIVQREKNMNKTQVYNLEVFNKNGDVLIVEILSKPLDYRGIKSKIASLRDMSEINIIKEKLHITTEKFETLVENSPDGVVILNRAGLIQYVSPAFVKLFPNKTAIDFLDQNLYEFFIPLYKNKIKTDLDNIRNGHFSGITEYVGEKEDGKKIYVECTGDVLKDINNQLDSIFLIVRDVSERKISENALIESESRFKGLFNNSKDAIIIQKVEDMKIFDANPKASELFGYSENELITMSFRELLSPEKRTIDLDSFVEEHKMFESFAFTKYNTMIYIQISVSKVLFNENVYHLLTIRDMTVVKQQEDRLKQIATKLQASNAMKDKMFSIISHDLRGPIGNLKTMLEFIAENPTEFDRKELFEIIASLEKSSNQTYELLENLLSWAKSQQDLLEYQPEIFYLSETINSSVKFMTETAKMKNITINTKLDEFLQVKGDKNMIKVVLRNLLSNAIKFSYENSNISVYHFVRERNVIVGVRDKGVGISPENLKSIFDKTNFTTTFGTNKEKGSGLGLKLCKDFVTKNNGKMWVESKLNEGTTFYFTLKIAQ